MKNNSNILPEIKPETIPNVLIIGNGLNRCFAKDSWDEILKDVSKGKVCFSDDEIDQIKTMPYPLQAVVMTGDAVDEAAGKISDNLADSRCLPEQKQLILDGICGLPADAILTTNYSYEIENALDQDFICRKGRPSKYRKTTKSGNKVDEQFGVFKYMSLMADDDLYQIWHIHGEVARPNSIVLGHYYYGKILNRIQQYSADVIKKYNIYQKKKIPFRPFSWIDYFLIGNVYMIGLGMDLSEMDLWWLVNCKARNFGDREIHLWSAKLDDKKNFTKSALMNAYGIHIHTGDIEKDEEYIDFYKKAFQEIREILVSQA